MSRIAITPHFSGFWVIRKANDAILADHRHYADAVAAAHLFAREEGAQVDPQPEQLRGVFE